jgi:putative acetyltransferase
MLIRPEKGRDFEAVDALNDAAFGTPVESGIVRALRVEGAALVSLVAEQEGTVVGHIAFSPVTLASDEDLLLVGLGPMAVLPGCQGSGIGSALVRDGLERCRILGTCAVFVVGYPAFYARFGFVSADRFGIGCEYDVPKEVFLALELVPGCLAGRHGTVRYHRAFAAP